MNQRLEMSPPLVLARLARFKPHWGIQLLLFLVVATVCLTILPVPVQMIGIMLDLDNVVKIMSNVGSLDDSMKAASDLMFSGGLFQVFALLSFGMIIVGVVIYVRYVEHRPIASMGARRRAAVRQYLMGAFIGFAMMAVSIGISAAVGLVNVTPNMLTPAIIGTILMLLPAWMVQGAGEEFLCRGYLMPSLVAGRMPAVAAALVSAAVFSCLHIANDGYGPLALFQVFCMGVLFAFYVIRTGSLWGACAMHSIWNFSTMNIFGDQVDSSLLIVTYNGSMGSLGAETVMTGVLFIVLLAVLFVPKGWYKPLTDEEYREYAIKFPPRVKPAPVAAYPPVYAQPVAGTPVMTYPANTGYSGQVPVVQPSADPRYGYAPAAQAQHYAAPPAYPQQAGYAMPQQAYYPAAPQPIMPASQPVSAQTQYGTQPMVQPQPQMYPQQVQPMIQSQPQMYPQPQVQPQMQPQPQVQPQQVQPVAQPQTEAWLPPQPAATYRPPEDTGGQATPEPAPLPIRPDSSDAPAGH